MNWMRLKLSRRPVGQRPHGQGLGQAGHAFEQDVAAGEQADQQAVEHDPLADDDLVDLGVERVRGRRAGRAPGG